MDDLLRLRNTLNEWMESTSDQGREPESDAMYDSDMALYLKGQRRSKPEQAEILERNIKTMKKWEAEGR